MDYDRIGRNGMRDYESESNPQRRKELNRITPGKASAPLRIRLKVRGMGRQLQAHNLAIRMVLHPLTHPLDLLTSCPTGRET